MTRLVMFALYVEEGHEIMVREAVEAFIKRLRSRGAPIIDYESIYGAHRNPDHKEPVLPGLMRYYDPFFDPRY